MEDEFLFAKYSAVKPWLESSPPSPTEEHIVSQEKTKELQEAHTRLRERLLADEYLGPKIVSVFLQGSYRRSTSIRPQGDDKLDVDLVAVTRFRRQDYPVADKVMDEFTSFLNKHYKGKWKRKGRSIGIEMSNVNLDLVIRLQNQIGKAGKETLDPHAHLLAA